MSWTFAERQKRAITKMINNGVVEEIAVSWLKRPRFFGKYPFCVSMTPTYMGWTEYDELSQKIRTALEPLGAHLVCTRNTFFFYIYGDDPAILSWIHSNHRNFLVTAIRQCDPDYWNHRLHEPNKSGPFYGEYPYRITLKSPYWASEHPQDLEQLEKLEIGHKVVTKIHPNMAGMETKFAAQRCFIYVRKVSEVLVLKLILGDQISAIDDRGEDPDHEGT